MESLKEKEKAAQLHKKKMQKMWIALTNAFITKQDNLLFTAYCRSWGRFPKEDIEELLKEYNENGLTRIF